MADREPVQVFKARNSVQAQFVCNLLAEADIAARVESTALEAVRGEVPDQKVSCPVLVAAADAERARALVAEYESRLKGVSAAVDESTEPYCYHCGGPVAAGQSPCPACGFALDWSE
jgi:hypothetical protein